MATPQELRAEAARHDREARDSFDRCDTDGFLSQWASGLTARQRRLEADLLERGNTSEFHALFTLDGEWVPAQVIDNRYGRAWMLLDRNGNRTGEYAPYLPARRTTMTKRGLLEGTVVRPAKVKMVGQSMTAVRPMVVAADRPWDEPLAIVTTDRWADE